MPMWELKKKKKEKKMESLKAKMGCGTFDKLVFVMES